MEFSATEPAAYELNDQVVLLQSLWRTEMNSPELLPYQEEVVETVKSILTNQQVSDNTNASTLIEN
jgi:hypothetical protein